MKKHFKFKKYYYDVIQKLDSYQQALMIEAIFAYVFDAIDPDFGSNEMLAIFLCLKNDIDNSNKAGAPKGNTNAVKKSEIEQASEEIEQSDQEKLKDACNADNKNYPQKQAKSISYPQKQAKSIDKTIEFDCFNKNQSVIHKKRKKLLA